MKLKSKPVFVVVGLMLAGALAGAQAQKSPIKKVRQQVSLSEDVKVGTTVLKSGKYEVASNDQGLTFRRMVQDRTYPSQWNYDMKQEPLVVKASATLLEAKSKGTQLDIADNAGVLVLKSITLDDTNIKFTIDQ